MAEKIRPELLTFLHGADLSYRILVVEDLTYLSGLRQMFPHAQLFAVARDPERMEPYEGLQVSFRALDYLAEPLPFEKESFDYIVSDLTLEQAGNVQDIAAGFSMYLKQTGSLLTSFRNIRHWSELQNLMDGHYYHVGSRLFAKPEFEKLLYASYYKCVHMRPQIRVAPDGLLERLRAAGFSNVHDDLETEFWLVKADRSMPELSLLKSMYTKAQRAELSRLLHRIEYGVQEKESVRAFWRLYQEIGLFPDYLVEFVHEAVFHPQWFYANLEEYTEGEPRELAVLLAAGKKREGAEA